MGQNRMWVRQPEGPGAVCPSIDCNDITLMDLFHRGKVCMHCNDSVRAGIQLLNHENLCKAVPLSSPSSSVQRSSRYIN